MKKRLDNERGSVDVRTMSPETRAAVEQMIVELRKKGQKISKFIQEQGYTREMLLTMRQVAKEMERDKKLTIQSDVKLDIGGRRKRKKGYKDAEGNVVDLYAPDTLPSQETLVKEIKSPVNRWGSGTSYHTMKIMEPQVMDLWGYPHRENQGMTARANTRDAKMLKSWEKPLSRKDRRELNTETLNNQRGGREILENAGWEIPTVELGLRSEKAAEVYGKLREFYDKLYDQINVVREKIGLRPMNKVANYSSFNALFDEGKNPFNMTTADINKLTNQHTKTLSLVESKHRSAVNLDRRVEMDAFKVANQYAQHANRFIHEAEHLARMHEHLNHWKNPIKVPNIDLDGNPRVSKKTGEPLYYELRSLKDINPSAHTWLMNWKDYQAGLSPISNMNVNVQKVMKQLSRHTVWGMMAANVTSGLNQLGAWVQSGTVLGHHLAGGLMDVINSTMPGSKKWQFMMDNSAHMPQRFGNFDVAVGHTTQGNPLWTGKSRTQRAAARFNKIRKPIADAAMKHISYTDMITAAATWFGGYRQGMKLYKGNKKKAIRHADDVTISTNASASTADRAPIQRHPLGAFVTTLQTFALANWDFIARDVFGWKNPELKTHQRVARVTKLLAGMSALGYLFEDVLNINSPMPNPVGELVKGIEDEDDLHELALRLAVEMAEVVPGAGSVIKYRGSLSGAVTGKIEDVLMARDSPEKAMYGLAYLMGLPGVSQVKKSMRQVEKDGSMYEILTGGLYRPKSLGPSSGGSRRRRRSRRTRRRTR